MIAIVALVAKATIILVLGLLAVRLAARNRASIRHAILAACFALIALLPAAEIVLPTFELPWLPAAQASTASSNLGPASLPAARPADPGTGARSTAPIASSEGTFALRRAQEAARTVLLIVWFAGTTALLASLVIGVVRVQRLRRSALPCLEYRAALTALSAQAGVRGAVDLVVHEDIAAPITCGLWRESIVLPEGASDWTQSAVARALVHELEHVKRRDWATQVAARSICAVYWFHPLVWMAYRQLCLEAEHACDDAVVAREEGTMYADQLVNLARRMASQPAVAVLGMAHRSDLAARVAAVLDSGKTRGRAGTLRAGVIALSAVAVLVAIAPLQLVAATDVRANVGDLTLTPEPISSREEANGGAPIVQRRANARLDSALVEAADAGDVDDVRAMLDAGGQVNAAVLGDGSPLIVAARGGHIDIVHLLLDRGADVNQAVLGDGAPIIMAAREGHLEIVRLLLDRGANVDLLVDGDENALIQASGAGHLEVVRLLVARGANVSTRAFARGNGPRGDEWRTPLNMALRGGHRDVADFLRSQGAVE